MDAVKSIEERYEKWMARPFRCDHCGTETGATIGEHVEAFPKHQDFCSAECREAHCKSEAERQEAEAKEATERRISGCIELFQASLPVRYRGMSAESWDGSEPTPEDVYDRWDGKLLLIFGAVGAGKTHLSVAIARLWLQDHQRTPLFYDALELVWKLRPQPNQERELRRDQILISLESDSLLILDDVGAERSTEFATEQLAYVIRERHRWEKPTILTSNFGPKKLEEWNLQVASRLHDGKIIRLDGPDRRMR